jgi:hypothetical protein
MLNLPFECGRFFTALRIPTGAATGVHLTDVHLIGVYLIGVHLTGCGPYKRASHWARIS